MPSSRVQALAVLAVLSSASAFVAAPSALNSVGAKYGPGVLSSACAQRRPLASRSTSMSTAEPATKTEPVKVNENAKHKLYFVEDVDHIDNGPITKTQEVPAWELTNNKNIKVKVMAQGGNMVEVSKNGVNYVWDNVEGACYYGANENAFPLTRGLILHGGIRYAAVTAEHGLYYDTDWDVKVKNHDDGAKSIVMSITDSPEQRLALNDPLSVGQYCLAGEDYPEPRTPMTKYPVTNMVFTYTITLKPDEEFVRLRMDVFNPTKELVHGEAWLPMTFPIDAKSQIISPQKKRWRRDEWCFQETANIVNFDTETLLTPLKWKTSGIYYDFPTMDGNYHAVNLPSKGRGCAYVVDSTKTHFSKLWSWGDKANFVREDSNALAKGRPAAEYYEPWSSAFNHAFFQTSEFLPGQTVGWSAAILPIESGLEHAEIDELRATVENSIKQANITF